MSSNLTAVQTTSMLAWGIRVSCLAALCVFAWISLNTNSEIQMTRATAAVLPPAGSHVLMTQENDKKAESGESGESNDDKKPMTERERRLESLSKSIEKEERPDRPSFSGINAAKRKGGAVTFDDIKFEMKKGQRFDRQMLTDSINELVGGRLSIKGYIRPSIRQRDLKKFIFVRDDKECCFGPGAAIFDCVLVTLADGETSDYTVRPITIEGDFYLKEFKGPDGRIWAVYRMNNSKVKK